MVSCFGIQKPRIPRYSIECLYLGHTLTSSVLFTVHQGSGGMSNISTKKFFLLVSLMLAQYGNLEPVVVTYKLQYGEAKLIPFLYTKGINFAFPYCIAPEILKHQSVFP